MTVPPILRYLLAPFVRAALFFLATGSIAHSSAAHTSSAGQGPPFLVVPHRRAASSQRDQRRAELHERSEPAEGGGGAVAKRAAGARPPLPNERSEPAEGGGGAGAKRAAGARPPLPNERSEPAEGGGGAGAKRAAGARPPLPNERSEPAEGGGGAGAKRAAGARPPLLIKLSARDRTGDWELRFENRSQVPYQLVGDLRLLSLEVRTPGGKLATCRLPRDTRPDPSAPWIWTIIEPEGSLVRHFDPRFYCFAPSVRKALVAGSSVTAVLGSNGTHGGGAILARPTGSGVGPAMRRLEADAITLDATNAPEFVELRSPDPPPRVTPVFEMVRGSDATNARAVTASVRLRNPTGRRMVAYVRRDLLSFDVVGEQGTVTCTADDEPRDPTRGAYTTLRPHGTLTLVSRLVELCPRGTFAGRGIYLVGATFESAENGSDVGLNAFTGTLETRRFLPIRVRHSITLYPNKPTPPTARRAPPPRPPLPTAPARFRPAMPMRIPGRSPFRR